jgi:glycosyltransferase involved in cell wall biosynthesis
MRVVIVSAFIDPQAVGEPRWCYDLAKAISERVDSVIIAQTPINRSYSIAELFPNAEVHETAGWQLNWLDKRMKALIKPNYVKFQRFAERVIRQDLVAKGVTCGHHFGPLGMRYPTPLRRSGIPYVMGPVGGSLPLPPGFEGGGTKDPWYYKLRDIDQLRFRFDPAIRATYANADIVVGAAQYVRDILHEIPLRRFAAHSQRFAKIPPIDVEATIAARAQSAGPLRLLIASRLIFSKGVHYALQALGQIKERLPAWRLDILGDGVYRGELEQLTARLGLADNVVFHGHTPRDAVDDFYRQADIFLFPTIREPSGAVIFEAMAWGLPQISANYGGPATHVTDDLGITAPVDSPAAFVDGLAVAIERLGQSPQLRLEMGRNALAAARNWHSVEEMVDFFVDLYGQISRPA